jgi:thiol:disulfide interchange protein
MVDALLTGVLAVAVASPCTAPFMGASLGLAVTLPTAQALPVFAALGLGMALPYLAASAWPALARAAAPAGRVDGALQDGDGLPDVRHRGLAGVGAGPADRHRRRRRAAGPAGGAGLRGLGLGSPTLGPSARGGFGAAALVLLAVALVWALPTCATRPWRQVPGAASRLAALVARARGPGAAEGRPVFVDFTAAWCVTCQFNKRTTLADAEVKADFEARKVLLLRADWTRRDAAISAELARMGRSGVPVYALYAPGQAGPTLLSEILSPDRSARRAGRAARNETKGSADEARCS